MRARAIMASRWYHLIHLAKEALFPARCIGCGAACPWQPPSAANLGLGGILCPQCDTELAFIESPLCISCGRPFVSDQGVDHICGGCRHKAYAFESARAAGLYTKALKALIHQYKYRCSEPLAGPLGRLLWTAFRRHWSLDDVDLIVPVPLHRRRLRKRGFNQAGLLLRSWPRLAANEGLSLNRDRIDKDLLVRRRYTMPQAGLDRKARQVNVRNAFALDKGSVCGLRILLVDDVFTTGATAHACAQVLQRAGAASVKLLTLARAAH